MPKAWQTFQLTCVRHRQGYLIVKETKKLQGKTSHDNQFNRKILVKLIKPSEQLIRYVYV